MKTLFILATLFFISAPEWLANFEVAKNTATQEHKYILLNFSGSDWCGPCRQMKKEVFETEAFLSMAEDELVLVRADFPRLKKNQLPKEQVKSNEALAEKYNPSGKFPLTVLLDAEGTIIKEWDGYIFGSQEKFMNELVHSIPGH